MTRTDDYLAAWRLLLSPEGPADAAPTLANVARLRAAVGDPDPSS